MSKGLKSKDNFVPGDSRPISKEVNCPRDSGQRRILSRKTVVKPDKYLRDLSQNRLLTKETVFQKGICPRNFR